MAQQSTSVPSGTVATNRSGSTSSKRRANGPVKSVTLTASSAFVVDVVEVGAVASTKTSGSVVAVVDTKPSVPAAQSHAVMHPSPTTTGSAFSPSAAPTR